jgi:hypothetical protein
MLATQGGAPREFHADIRGYSATGDPDCAANVTLARPNSEIRFRCPESEAAAVLWHSTDDQQRTTNH